MQRPGLLNEINFYPKSILAKEKNFYTYSKIINCSKFITPTRKKKKQISTPKKCLMLTQKHAQKKSFFQTKQYFTPTWKNQFSAWKKFLYLPEKKIRWNNFSLQLEKTEIPPEKNFLYYHRKSNFPTEKIIILFRKNPISEGKNILYLSEKNSKFLILTLPRPYPPLPVKKRFLKQKKSKILQLRCVLNTALLLF